MNSTNGQNIRVSAVIPCRNEQAFIGACIYSVLDSDYSSEALEILVCDGMSEDGTAEVVNTISKAHPNVKLLQNQKQTTPYALNLGISKASGDVVIILGAHATLSHNYISECVTALSEDESLGCVGGVLHNTSSDLRSEAIANAMSHPFGVGSAYFRTGQKSGYVDTVAFGAYKREVFDNIGMFDETLIRNQDDEFNYRVVKAGYKIKLDTSISATYHVRASYKKLLKQYYQYGYWKVYVNKKHKVITSFRQVVPAIFILYLTLGLILSLTVPVLAPVYLIILSLYLFLGLLSAFASTVNPITAFMTLYAFIILHFSYGVGYLE